MSSKEEKLILQSILSSQSVIAKTSDEKDKENLKAMEKIAPYLISKESMIDNWKNIEEYSYLFSKATGFDFQSKISEYVDDIRFWINIAPECRIIEDLFMRLKKEVDESYDRSNKRLNNVMLNADRANQHLLNKGTRVINEAERFKELERIGAIEELENE